MKKKHSKDDCSETKPTLLSLLGPLRADVKYIQQIIKEANSLSSDKKDAIMRQQDDLKKRIHSIESLEIQCPYYAEKLEEIKNELGSFISQLEHETENHTKNHHNIEILNNISNILLGKINKILYIFYKEETLKSIKLGGTLSLTEPASDLEGLNDGEKNFLFGELENKISSEAWIDTEKKIIYRVSSNPEDFSRNISIFIICIILGGFFIYLVKNFELYKILDVDQIPYTYKDLFNFYFFGLLGFSVHIGKKLYFEGYSKITTYKDFLKWFSIKWINFICTFGIFLLGLILLVCLKQGSIANSLLLGYSIDSFSEIIIKRYKVLIPAATKNIKL
jgi:hypothetical protein